MKKTVITPCMYWSTRRGSCDLPLKSPKTQPMIRRPSKSSMGCSGIILGVGWIPSTTVNPQPWIHTIYEVDEPNCLKTVQPMTSGANVFPLEKEPTLCPRTGLTK